MKLSEWSIEFESTGPKRTVKWKPTLDSSKWLFQIMFGEGKTILGSRLLKRVVG